MTCIVGIKDENNVYMGCDSLGSNGHTKVVRKDKKMFRVGDFLIGYTTSYRMGQLLEYSQHKGGLEDLKAPEKNIFKFMVNDFAERVRSILKEGGFTNINNSVEKGGTFLIATKGHLFKMESDFQISENSQEYDSCGSGEEVAMGSLFSTAKLLKNPEDRILLALESASKISCGVEPPFLIEKV